MACVPRSLRANQLLEGGRGWHYRLFPEILPGVTGESRSYVRKPGIRYYCRMSQTGTSWRRIAQALTHMLRADVTLLTRVIRSRCRRFPLIKDHQRWSIGVLAGDTLWSLAPHPKAANPVLSFEDVSDIHALYVSDPFLVRVDSEYFLFFEVMNRRNMRGEIGLARSLDGTTWDYHGIVLADPFHLSYPYVFEWEGEYYLLPESHEALGVRLYASDSFPTKWSLRSTLLRGRYVDPSIFRAASRWWLFVGEFGNEVLRLFYSTGLHGPYLEHPASPIVAEDAHSARPAGRVLAFDGRIFRCAQDDDPLYGSAVNLFEITALSPNEYEEVPAGQVLAASGSGWNACGMHHLDAMQLEDGRWLALADGWKRAWHLDFGCE